MKSFDFVLSIYLFLFLPLLLLHVDRFPIKIPLCHQRFSILNLRQTGVATVMNVSHSCNNNLEYFLLFSVPVCVKRRNKREQTYYVTILLWNTLLPVPRKTSKEKCSTQKIRDCGKNYQLNTLYVHICRCNYTNGLFLNNSVAVISKNCTTMFFL